MKTSTPWDSPGLDSWKPCHPDCGVCTEQGRAQLGAAASMSKLASPREQEPGTWST